MTHPSEQGVYEKHRNQTGYGKGDKPRPVDRKKFNKHFDEIDWGHERKPSAEPRTRKVY